MLASEITVDPTSLPANANLIGNTLFWDLGNISPRTGGKITSLESSKMGTVAGLPR
jgi:hypothetical protein